MKNIIAFEKIRNPIGEFLDKAAFKISYRIIKEGKAIIISQYELDILFEAMKPYYRQMDTEVLDEN